VSVLARLWVKTLPFVTRSPKMKVAWLVSTIRKNILSSDEIKPYLRLLLSEYEDSINNTGPDQGKASDAFTALFAKLDSKVLLRLVECTDIYDVPKLMKLVPKLTVEEGVIILLKAPPPYEKKPDLLLAKIYQAMYECSGGTLEQAANQVKESAKGHEYFEKSYERFREILDDEKFLTSLFPNAKGFK